MWRGLALAILTIAVLVLDFILFPDVFEDEVYFETLSANQLANGDNIKLGKYHLHIIRVSIGLITDENYMHRLGSNALAVTAFSAAGIEGPAIGTLAESLKNSLPAHDSERLLALVNNSPTLKPGRVQVLELTKPHTSGSLSGIETVLVMRTKQGGDPDAKEALKAGLKEVMDQSGKHSVSSLLLPTLAVAPGEVNSPTFDDFFRFLFEAMHKSDAPHLIDISFFENWSAAELEKATTAFNAQWISFAQDRPTIIASLHRFQLRLLLIGLAICFFVSSRRITMGPKAICIVATTYPLMLLGAFKTMEVITEGLGDTKNLVLIFVTFVTALGFPSLVGWSVKDLFSEEVKHGGG